MILKSCSTGNYQSAIVVRATSLTVVIPSFNLLIPAMRRLSIPESDSFPFNFHRRCSCQNQLSDFIGHRHDFVKGNPPLESGIGAETATFAFIYRKCADLFHFHTKIPEGLYRWVNFHFTLRAYFSRKPLGENQID